VIDPSAYRRLFTASIKLSIKSFIETDPDEISLSELRDHCLKTEKREIRWVDDDNIITHRYMHALHCLRIMFQFDVDEFKEPDPLKYCYRLDENGVMIHY